jgi:hypothetical protein
MRTVSLDENTSWAAWGSPYVDPGAPPPPFLILPEPLLPVSRAEFEALKREVLELKQLLQRALDDKKDDLGFTYDQVIGGRA